MGLSSERDDLGRNAVDETLARRHRVDGARVVAHLVGLVIGRNRLDNDRAVGDTVQKNALATTVSVNFNNSLADDFNLDLQVCV